MAVLRDVTRADVRDVAPGLQRTDHGRDRAPELRVVDRRALRLDEHALRDLLLDTSVVENLLRSGGLARGGLRVGELVRAGQRAGDDRGHGQREPPKSRGLPVGGAPTSRPCCEVHYWLLSLDLHLRSSCLRRSRWPMAAPGV